VRWLRIATQEIQGMGHPHLLRDPEEQQVPPLRYRFGRDDNSILSSNCSQVFLGFLPVGEEAFFQLKFAGMHAAAAATHLYRVL
jgi:hypothetical protein